MAFRTIELNGEQLLQRTTEHRLWETIFRGVEQSSYPLVPSAFRKKGKRELKAISEAFVNGHRSLFDITEAKFPDTYYEFISLMWFWDIANKRGIRVPDIPHMYNGNMFFEAQGTIDKLLKEYDPRDWVGISAIAQHYNLPTRLLDWTYDMDAAIFFATRNITLRQIKDTAKLLKQ